MGKRVRETERQRDRQTDRQTERQTYIDRERREIKRNIGIRQQLLCFHTKRFYFFSEIYSSKHSHTNKNNEQRYMALEKDGVMRGTRRGSERVR